MKIIAIGSSALMHGFALLGIETHADQDAQQINQCLLDLYRNRQRALVFIQQDLLQQDIPMMHRLRDRGGNILICVIPTLQQVDDYQPEVEKLITRVLGASVLEK